MFSKFKDNTMKIIQTFIKTVFTLSISCSVSANTTSPFSPPEEKLGTYIVNSGSGLDTGCTYRGGGPLRIKLPIPAVVNPDELNADGTLKDPKKLIDNKVIASKAILSLPVYDIDSGYTSSSYAPEIDKLYFNGKYQKTLSGKNRKWTDDGLSIDISEVKFGKDNEVRIDIDTDNSREVWCMAVDWVALDFDVAPPYVLFHGIYSDASTWDAAGNNRTTLDALNDIGVLYTRFSVTGGNATGGCAQTNTYTGENNTGPHGFSACNAKELRTKTTDFLKPLKAKRVNVLAHSKGGLDAQAMANLKTDFKILSLSTLSTPHLGSPTADITKINQEDVDDYILQGTDPNGFVKEFKDIWTFGAGPKLPGIYDLTTHKSTQQIISGLRGNINPTYTIGAFADANGNAVLDSSEVAGMTGGSALLKQYRKTWNVMRNVSSVNVVNVAKKKGFFGTNTTYTYTVTPTTNNNGNDIVVTTKSANPSYGVSLGNRSGNHTTVKRYVNAKLLIEKTIKLR